MDCLFCRIIAGEIPSQAVYQDDSIYAFTDIHPQAPTHVLVLPRKHIASLASLSPGDQDLMGRMQMVVAGLARTLGLAKGFRTVINTGSDGGQTVDHLHIHLLGGRAMHWPPG